MLMIRKRGTCSSDYLKLNNYMDMHMYMYEEEEESNGSDDLCIIEDELHVHM